MTIDRLQAHWGFTRMPFGRDLAPGMLFASRTHAEAVARITWLIAEGAIGVLTGEVGAGKSVSTRAATAHLDHRFSVIYLGNPAVGIRGYLRQIVTALGGVPPFQTAPLVAEVMARLDAEKSERGRRVVVVCDEAHLLSCAQLEELRFLTNAGDMDASSPFACLLVGQPALRRRLKLGAYAALDQRIATRYTLPPMDLADSAAYLRHHLALAGRSDALFADDAIARLHRVANGLPRALNNAAVAALCAAAAEGKALVDDVCAKRAVAELTRD